jgi:hypothetical protein
VSPDIALHGKKFLLIRIGAPPQTPLRGLCPLRLPWQGHDAPAPPARKIGAKIEIISRGLRYTYRKTVT